jgi:hypothetical protein
MMERLIGSGSLLEELLHAYKNSKKTIMMTGLKERICAPSLNKAFLILSEHLNFA